MEKNTVFISYKNSDDGNMTEDAKIADALYVNLCKLGVKTFYSNVTLIETGSSLYKEAIEHALDESVVLILIGTKINYIESKWVKYEWSSFHEDILAENKPNGIIIPYISENIQRVEKPIPLRNLETFLIEKNSLEELTAFVINYLRTKELLYEESVPTIYEMGIGEHSNYRAFSTDERKIIEIQSRLTLDTDLDIITDLLNKSKSHGKKYILDVGSAEGATIKSRMSHIHNMDLRVVGIDRDSDIIKMANINNNDSRITFANIEVESDEFESKMKEYLEKEKIPGFDLVIITLVLRHLKDPVLAITRIKKFINKHGYIYIREQDDGSLVSYGDKGLINKIINKHSSLSGVSDHYYGRKVHSHLLEAGFRNISSHSVIRDIVNKTEHERVAIFYTQFMKRKNFIEYLLSQKPSDILLRDTLDWFGVALNRLLEYFLQTNFYFSETDFVFWAQKDTE